MAEPKDVKEPSESEKLLNDFFKGAAPDGENTEIKDLPADSPPPKADEAIPAETPNAESTEKDELQTVKADLETALAQISELSAALTAAQAALLDENSDTWKHKHNVLDGIMRKQGPEQAAKIKELEAENEKLRQAPSKPAPSALGNEPLSEEDQAFIDEAGISEKAFRYMAKRFTAPKAEAKPPVEPKPEITREPETPPAKTAAQETEKQPSPADAAFLTLVSVKAKGWQDVNANPISRAAFAAFADTKPGGEFGPRYRDIMADAVAGLDADTVAKVYNAFFATTKKPAAPVKPSRESADSRSRGGGTTVIEDTWTPERIMKFNDDVNLGIIPRGSEEFNTQMASYEKWRKGQK